MAQAIRPEHQADDAPGPLSRACNCTCALIALGFLFILALPGQAFAASKHAAYIVDGNSGRALHASNEDEPRYPASLTKIMTLYMLFEELKAGRATTGTKISISEFAASQTPSKLGLKPGSTITVENAIRALVTKSANDIAVAVAEHIGGSERRFAEMMTTRARQLGMSQTTFRNASGLPNSTQLTTARDMAQLGFAVIDHHPSLYGYFKTRHFRYGKKNYKNHNGLLFNFEGTDGIKTGYTRASGFNLVASVRRDGKHVVGVVMGGKSAGKRNATMRSLLRTALGKASRKRSRQPVPSPTSDMIARTPQPLPRQSVAATQSGPQSIEELLALAQPVEVKPNRRGVTLIAESRPLAPAPATAPIGLAGFPNAEELPWRTKARQSTQVASQPRRATAQPRGRNGTIIVPWPQAAVRANKPAQTAAAPAVGTHLNQGATTARTNAAAPGAYHVQVGAFVRPADADRKLQDVIAATGDLFAGHPPVTIPHQSASKLWYRARFSGFEKAVASRACAALKTRKIDCIIVPAQ